MRSTTLPVVLLLVLSACALPQQRSVAVSPYQPIEAYITGTTPSGPLFRVNRPAYVAMFYIVPGGGVSMIYPGFGRGSLSGRVFAGSHFATNRLSNQHQFLFTRSTLGQPRYLFLIASDRPLDTEQFGTFGDNLLFRLGTHFNSYSAYSTMEELARLTLPSLADDGSWTTDMFVVWPSVIYSEPAEGLVLVSCGNYSMYVPRSYVSVVRTVICEAQQQERPGVGEPAEGEKKPVRPGAREPVPAQPETGDLAAPRAITAEQRAAIRERVVASSQLAAPRMRPDIGGARGELERSGVGSRARPAPDGGWRSGDSRTVDTSDRASSAGTRPSAPAARSPRPSNPAASPSPSAGSGRKPVAAPASSPSSGGSDSGSSRGARPAPSRD